MFILHFRNMAVWTIFTKTRQPKDRECNRGMVLRAEGFSCGAKDIANGLESTGCLVVPFHVWDTQEN